MLYDHAVHSALQMLLPGTSAMFQKAGMLAPDGRCKALDADAQGYVRSEACALMLLAVGSQEGAMAVLAGEAVRLLAVCLGLCADMRNVLAEQ